MTIKKSKLKNGLTVLTVPRTETKAVTLFILFGVGSRYEPKEINGISHFLEHMFFKGTKKRPSTLEISQELDKLGAEYNAMTSKDYTGYYIKVNAEKTTEAFDILSDMLFNSVFDPTMINQEKGVIVEEINMYEDNPLMYVQDLFEQAVYGKSNPLGQLIAGSKNKVRQINRQKLLNYRKKYYHPRNAVLIAAGRIKNSQLQKLAEKYLAKEKKKKKSKYQPAKNNQQRPRVNLVNKKSEQIQLGLGFPAYSYFDRRYYALEVLNNILGGMMSSRLFIEIRVKRSLAYFINSSLNIYQDTGNLMIQAGLDKKRVKEAIQAILAEVSKLKNEKVSRQELQKAKDNIKGKIVLKMEDSESVAGFLGKQYLLTNKLTTPQEHLQKISAVTPEQIQKIAQDLFCPEKINLAAIGPSLNKQKLLKLMAFQ